MMDMMCVRVQDHLNSLRFTETSAVQEDMKVAENLMKDARNSKTVRTCSSPQIHQHYQHSLCVAWRCSSLISFTFLSQLLPNLYHLKSAGSTGTCIGAIQDKLESMAGEIAAVMDDQLQVQNGHFYLWNVALISAVWQESNSSLKLCQLAHLRRCWGPWWMLQRPCVLMWWRRAAFARSCWRPVWGGWPFLAASSPPRCWSSPGSTSSIRSGLKCKWSPLKILKELLILSTHTFF